MSSTQKKKPGPLSKKVMVSLGNRITTDEKEVNTQENQDRERSGSINIQLSDLRGTSSDRSKRRRMEAEESDEEEILNSLSGNIDTAIMDTYTKIELLLQGINDKKSLSNVDRKEFRGLFQSMVLFNAKLSRENAYLRGRIAERTSGDPMEQSSGSYAGAAKGDGSQSTGNQKINRSGAWPELPRRKGFGIVISARDRNLNAATIKDTITKRIDPSRSKIKIQNLRMMGYDRVLVQTADAEDRENLMSHPTLTEAGLQCIIEPEKLPRIIIYDVPRELEQPGELVEAIATQNTGMMGNQGAEAHIPIRPLFKTGRRDTDTVNWVCEVPSQVRDNLMNRGRVFIKWRSCRVREYLAISRCYKCQGLGHIAGKCRAPSDVCGHCDAEGHRKKDCNNRNANPKWPLCAKKGWKNDHPVEDKKCPVYIAAIKRLQV